MAVAADMNNTETALDVRSEASDVLSRYDLFMLKIDATISV